MKDQIGNASKYMKRSNRRTTSTASVVIALAIVAIVGVWFYSGSIEVNLGDTSINVKTRYWADLGVNYSEINNISYRKELNVGERKAGVGSAKLSVGTFQNEEFGTYTLYAFTDAKEYIVLTTNEQTIVIGMSNIQDTQAIFDTLIERLEN